MRRSLLGLKIGARRDSVGRLMAAQRRSMRGVILTVILGAAMSGSCETNTLPPPEAVLAGTWLLTGEQISSFLDKTLVFNSTGRLTQISTRSINIFGAEQRVVERNLNIASSVSGNNVRVVLTADLVFEGTFNGEQSEANGKLQTETSFFDTTVITDQGPGKIVKL